MSRTIGNTSNECDAPERRARNFPGKPDIEDTEQLATDENCDNQMAPYNFQKLRLSIDELTHRWRRATHGGSNLGENDHQLAGRMTSCSVM